ncbi:hypothetical protein MRX96_041228 [Rhipicephalus microplus]
MEEIKERSRSRSKHRKGSRGRAGSFPRLPERQEGELPPMTGPVNEGLPVVLSSTLGDPRRRTTSQQDTNSLQRIMVVCCVCIGVVVILCFIFLSFDMFEEDCNNYNYAEQCGKFNYSENYRSYNYSKKYYDYNHSKKYRNYYSQEYPEFNNSQEYHDITYYYNKIRTPENTLCGGEILEPQLSVALKLFVGFAKGGLQDGVRRIYRCQDATVRDAAADGTPRTSRPAHAHPKLPVGEEGLNVVQEFAFDTQRAHSTYDSRGEKQVKRRLQVKDEKNGDFFIVYSLLVSAPDRGDVGCLVTRRESTLFWWETVPGFSGTLLSIKGHLFHCFARH